MKRIWKAGLLVLVLGLMSVGVVAAQTTPPAVSVPASAQVNGTGLAPTVDFNWQLPDMQPSVAGIQYGTATNSHQHDDDMSTVGIQITPVLDDDPIRLMEYWWVVESPYGIGAINDAFIRVLATNGQLKYQLHGTAPAYPAMPSIVRNSSAFGWGVGPSDYLQPNTAADLTTVPCSALSSWTAVGTPLEAAIDTGQLTAAQAENIYVRCTKQEVEVFRVVGPLTKKQPAGTDTVVAYVADTSGNIGQLSKTFTDLPIVGWKKDFTTINWGAISPNTFKVLSGDRDFGSTPPTIENMGNIDIFLNVNFHDLAGATLGKVINSFDISVGTETLAPPFVTIDPVASGAPVCVNRALLSNDPTELDLSIHPKSIPNDSYSGSIDMWVTTSCTTGS